MYKLKSWIDINKIDLKSLSSSLNAIELLEKNMDKIDWFWLSRNPNAIHLLEKNMDKIDWQSLKE